MADLIERIPLFGTIVKEQREYIETLESNRYEDKAFMQSLIDESKGWDSLDNQASKKDVNWSDYVQNHKDCWEAYVENPLAKGYVDRLTDFVVKDGFQVISEDEKTQDAIDEYMASDDFDWDIFQTQSSREVAIYGELLDRFFPKFESTVSVLVDPTIITSIETDPENANKVKQYRLEYTPVEYDAEGNAKASATPIKKWVPADEIVHLKVNTVSTATRGISDLLCNLKWLKRHKAVATNLVRRSNIQMSIIGEKIITGPGVSSTTVGGYKKTGDEATSTESGKYMERTIRPGTWNVHGKNIEYVLTPIPNDVRGMVDLLKALSKIICAGFGVGEHWLGDSSESNLATATSLELPILAKFSRRQNELKGFFKRHFKKVLAANGIENAEFDVIPPELSDKDAVQFAQAIKTLAEGVILLIGEDLLSQENAAKTIGDYLDNFDSFDKEKEKIKAEKETKEKDEAEKEPPDLPLAIPPELIQSFQEADMKLSRAGMDELLTGYAKEVADAFIKAKKKVLGGLKKAASEK